MPEQNKTPQKLTLKKSLSLAKESQIYQQIKRFRPAQNSNIEDGNSSQSIGTLDPRRSSQNGNDVFKKALTWLLHSFPCCFNLKDPIPLKKRIELDIFRLLPMDGSIPKTSIIALLAYYTDRILYHSSILAKQYRLDLEGRPISQVTKGEKEYSRTKLDWKETQKEKKLKQSTKSGDKAAD